MPLGKPARSESDASVERMPGEEEGRSVGCLQKGRRSAMAAARRGGRGAATEPLDRGGEEEGSVAAALDPVVMIGAAAVMAMAAKGRGAVEEKVAERVSVRRQCCSALSVGPEAMHT